MSRKLSAAQKSKAYAWVAYMTTHHPEEMARVRKYGTPSDELADMRVSFPLSLNTSSGQKLLHTVMVRFDAHYDSIPQKSFELFQHVKATIRHRRSDTQENLHRVAEALLHRSAAEFKQEVLFAFDSINAWINAVYKKTLAYHTIRRCLEMLDDQGIISVVEWGRKGFRQTATKIRMNYVTNFGGPRPAALDDWLMMVDHAMNAVCARESVTRQDVLEAAIHSFADKKSEEIQNSAEITQLLKRHSIEYLWFRNRAKVVKVEPQIIEEVTNEKTRVLLGKLVPAVQKDEPYGVLVGAGLSRKTGAGQGGGGSPGKRESVVVPWDQFIAELLDS